MNIQLIKSAYGATAPDSAAKNSGKKAAPEKSSTVPKEQVELSDTSLNMQKLRDLVMSAPDIRIPVVDEIRNKIKENRYPLESNLYKAMEKLFNDKIL